MSKQTKTGKDFWRLAESVLDVEDEMKEEEASKKKPKNVNQTRDPSGTAETSASYLPSEPTFRIVFSHKQKKGGEKKTSEWRTMAQKEKGKTILRYMQTKITTDKELQERKNEWLFTEEASSNVRDFKQWKHKVLDYQLPSASRVKRSIELDEEGIRQDIKNNKGETAQALGVTLPSKTGKSPKSTKAPKAPELPDKPQKKAEGEKKDEQDFTLDELINLVEEEEDVGDNTMAKEIRRKPRAGETETRPQPKGVLKKKQVKVTRRMQALREMCVPLSDKRPVRHALVKAATGGRSTILNEFRMSKKDEIIYRLERLSIRILDCCTMCLPWQKDIESISGQFGAVYANFFTMFRRMIAIQFLTVLLVVCIIIIPQVVQDRLQPSNITLPSCNFHVTDLLTGEGSLHSTYLFYSGYSFRSLKDEKYLEYPAFRFILATFFILLLLTTYIFYRLTSYYSTMRHETKVAHLAKNDFFKLVFCGWNFNVRDNNARIQLQKTLHRELQLLARNETFNSAQEQAELENKRILAWFARKYGYYKASCTVNILANGIVLCICAISGVATWFLNDLGVQYTIHCFPIEKRDNRNMTPRVVKHSDYCPDGNNLTTIWTVTVPAIVSAVFMTIFPKIIVHLADLETWPNPSRKIYTTMIRVGMFRFTTMTVLYTYYIAQAKVLAAAGFAAETFIGKELYRLVIYHCLINAILYDVCMWIYHCIRTCGGRVYKMTEFRTEYYALIMFYLQSLSLFGTLFFPPISIFILVRYIVDFYRCKYALFKRSTTVLYSNKVGQLYTPFLLSFHTLSYLTTSFLLMYYMNSIHTVPSKYNGPFLGKPLYSTVLKPVNFEIIKILRTPHILICFNLILIVIVYLMVYWSRIYPPIIAEVNAIIARERNDRNLILETIFKIIEKLHASHSKQKHSGSDENTQENADEDSGNSYVNEKINHVVNTMHARRMSTRSKRRKGIFRMARNFSTNELGSRRRWGKSTYQQHGRHLEAVAQRHRANRKEASGCVACAEKCVTCCEGLGYWIASFCKYCKNGYKTKPVRNDEAIATSPDSQESAISLGSGNSDASLKRNSRPKGNSILMASRLPPNVSFMVDEEDEEFTDTLHSSANGGALKQSTGTGPKQSPSSMYSASHKYPPAPVQRPIRKPRVDTFAASKVHPENSQSKSQTKL